jgi:hypothetical protein
MMNSQVTSPIYPEDEPQAWRPVGAVAAQFAVRTAALRARREDREAPAPIAWAAE